MYCEIKSAMLNGIDAFMVNVECDIRNGLPSFSMVGDLSSEVREAKDRVLTALHNLGIVNPAKRITINLSPADTKKFGSYFDLPIAVAILVCMGIVDEKSIENKLIVGEISLNGSINSVPGILSIAQLAKENKIDEIIVPHCNAKEAAIAHNNVIGIKDLTLLKEYLLKSLNIAPTFFDVEKVFKNELCIIKNNFSNIKGQMIVKRAAEIAIAGKHHILIVGSPGCGKSMISKAMSEIMPPLSLEESMELTKLYSASNLLSEDMPIMIRRPFRSPHHSASVQALAGGGRIPRPGEMSLAHKGILFLDELTEFKSIQLEIFRQPLEDKKIELSRAMGKYTYPADFQLVAAMNPCPCGYYPDKSKCNCTPYQIKKYLGKISGPLIDRIDISVEADRISYDELKEYELEEDSSIIRKRIIRAYDVQLNRYKGLGFRYNSHLPVKYIKEFCKLDLGAEKLLKNAFDELDLTARSYHKIIKVARTIADIEESDNIKMEHMSEAIFYRSSFLGENIYG